jgi:hypothetical protein
MRFLPNGQPSSAGLRRRDAVTAILSLCLASCASTHVSGPPSAGAAAPLPSERLQASVEYSGNPDYLPRMLQGNGAGEARTPVFFRYAYDVSYDVPTESGLNVFNPLLIVGVPKSTDVVVVKGVLEVLKPGTVLKRYEHRLVLDKSKTLFSEGETLSEIRRKGLLLVRDHIDEQLVADDSFLRAAIADK